MTETTPLRALADLLLPEGIDDFVTTRRAEGMSWTRLATAVAVATDQRVNPTHETLRGWYRTDPLAA